MLSSRPCAEEGSVDVGGGDLVVVVQAAVKHGSLFPCYTRVGDEDIEPAVELFYDLIDRFLNRFIGLNIDLVGLACGLDGGLVE
jgi:hypothetical protein